VRLLEHAELGRPIEIDSHRRELVLPFGAGAYVLRYRIEGETIVMIRVWHGREQRPVG
jgi:plasmid stabilization system protein ParE